MRTTRALIALAIACILALAGTACGSSSDGESSAGSEETTTTAGDSGEEAGTDSGDAATGPLLPGTLTVDGEDIELGPGRCLLEEQDADWVMVRATVHDWATA